jgi:cobalt-zinc-cadmium efflux system outer membrane protein
LYLHGNRKLTQEILDLMSRLEKIAQVRYANGLAAQQGRDPGASRTDHHAQ